MHMLAVQDGKHYDETTGHEFVERDGKRVKAAGAPPVKKVEPKKVEPKTVDDIPRDLPAQA
jgi:hypothetical protein